jgi:hypothetical protein
MPKMQVHRILVQEVKPGDMLMVQDVIGGVEVKNSYALGETRWALDIPVLRQMMQFTKGEMVLVLRKGD